MRTVHLFAATALVLLGCLGASGCGGEAASDEGAAAGAAGAVVLEGAVFWGPSETDGVDRAFVRVIDASRAVRCVATRCDGTFSLREGALGSLQFPVFVSVERAREPESPTPESLVVRRLHASVDEGAALRIHLFFDESTATAAKLPPTGSCAPGADVSVDLVECPEARR